MVPRIGSQVVALNEAEQRRTEGHSSMKLQEGREGRVGAVLRLDCQHPPLIIHQIGRLLLTSS